MSVQNSEQLALLPLKNNGTAKFDVVAPPVIDGRNAASFAIEISNWLPTLLFLIARDTRRAIFLAFSPCRLRADKHFKHVTAKKTLTRDNASANGTQGPMFVNDP